MLILYKLIQVYAITDEFFIVHLLSYRQNWDHLLLKSDESIAFCYFKIGGVWYCFFIQDFAKANFQKTKEYSESVSLMT